MNTARDTKSLSKSSRARAAKARSEASKSQNDESRSLDTTMRVTTPENISFQYEIVGPFRRLFAYGLDILISLFGYGAIVLVLYFLATLALIPLEAALAGTGIVQALLGIFGGMVQIGYFLVYWFYGAYMETYYNGQTFGKRAARMRVISTDGHAIDGIQATLRNFFRLMDIMPFVPLSAFIVMEQPSPIGFPTGIIGLLIMTLSPKFQRVGDLVAGTVVVNEERSRMPKLATFSDPRVAQLAELIPKSYVVPASMARAVADFVDQRRYLPPQRATEIATHLAKPLMESFGIASSTNADLFLCSLYYRTFVDIPGVEDVDVEVQSLMPQGHKHQPSDNPFDLGNSQLIDQKFEFPSLGSERNTSQ